jgi:hypothetical protein
MPQIYGATRQAYVIPCALGTIPSVLLIFISIRDHEAHVALIVATLLFPFIFFVGASALRLTLDDTGISYRRLFARTRRVQYADILKVKPVNVYVGRTGPHVGVKLTIRGDRSLTILCKPFSRDAYLALLGLERHRKEV